jgi:alkylation response protein AidB-like acyl-CoA dehydrogenase
VQFVLSEDQRLLTDAVRIMLTSECPPSAVRDAWDAGRFDAGRWKTLADLGVTGLTVPQDLGGMGLGFLDLVPVMVEAGRVALPEPLIEVAVSAGLLADLGGTFAQEWLPRIAAGDAVVVTACPEVDPYPVHVTQADLMVVCEGDDVRVAWPEELDVVPQPNVDPARPTASIARTDGEMAGRDAGDAIRRAAMRGATLAAAMQVGLGTAMIDQAVAYAKQREQFGKPIGTFQAVKHHLASALVDVQFARPLVERAAHSLDNGDPDVAVHVAMAKAFADEAANAAAKHALQVHGAIGYTWECDLQLFMKRAWSLAASFGATEHHWRTLDRTLV